MTFKVQVTQQFERSAKRLRKKYPSLAKDLVGIIQELEAGLFPGSPISGLKNKIFKVRIKNSDNQKGKSGGYRMIYYCANKAMEIFLLTIYSKAEQSTISTSQIQEILRLSENLN